MSARSSLGRSELPTPVPSSPESSPSGPSGSSLLTAAQLAERWQVPEAHVYRLAREGKVQTVRLGRYRRWRIADIEHFEQEGGADA
jgi:excisionase family DNA binding protein